MINIENYKVEKKDIVFNWEAIRDFIGTVCGNLLDSQKFLRKDEENVYLHFHEWRIVVVEDAIDLLVDSSDVNEYKQNVIEKFNEMPELVDWIIDYTNGEKIDNHLWSTIADVFYDSMSDGSEVMMNYINSIATNIIFGDKYYALRYTSTHKDFNPRAMRIFKKAAWAMKGAEVLNLKM